MKNLTLTWGDVVITADDGELLIQDGTVARLSVTGNINLTRGPDHMTATRLAITNETMVAEGVVLIGPPLRFESNRLTGKIGQTLTLDAPTVGSLTGELKIQAKSLQLEKNGQMSLTEAQIKLWGARLIRVKPASLKLGGDQSTQGGPSLPLTYRSSAISGQVLGLRIPFKVYGFNALGDIDQTSRRGVQYGLALQKNLALRSTPGDWRRVPLGVDPKLPMPNAWSVARPEKVDTLLLADDILSQPSQVRTRTWTDAVRADIGIQWQHHREFATRRQGPLLLSKKPEVIYSATYPLSPARVPLTRNGMTTVRWTAFLEAATGRYEEVRLGATNQTISANRTGYSAGVASSPLLVGKDLLAGVQLRQTHLRYSGDKHFNINEIGTGLEWKPAPYAGLGVAVIRRNLRGETPFFFDQVDAADEGQLRIRFPITRKLAGGILARRDLKQGHTFDTEYTIAVRSAGIEPRLTYRTLNRQLGLRFALPAFER
ncbi:MAG: hypothetical protein QM758_29825 [Armatimonas sp.]